MLSKNYNDPEMQKFRKESLEKLDLSSDCGELLVEARVVRADFR